MARGRSKKKAAADGDNGIGHNAPPPVAELTDEQQQALFFQHKRHYEAALAKKKEVDAAFKNICKQAKAELGAGAIPSIKDAILLETDDGEEKLRAEIERQLRVARWMNAPFGQQAELFTDASDPRPATERAFAEGKKAGMEGKPRKAPHAPEVPQFAAWMKGYEAGQVAIFKIKAPPAAPPQIGDAPTSHQVT